LIKTISTGTPIEFNAIREKSRAGDVKSTVVEVGERLLSLDQVDSVDKASAKGTVDVSDAKLPSRSLLGGVVSKLVPEKVSGFGEYDDKGQLQSLYTSSQDISGTKELQYQRNADGSQTYAVTTATGQTTVRETPDGRLFMLESPGPSQADFNKMAAADFAEPVLAPGEKPAKTVEQVLSEENIERAKAEYKEGVNRRADIVGGLFSGDTRGDALHKLGDELFGKWNPFGKKK
jgi:hypothetical protein